MDANGQQKKILIVDDEKDLSSLLQISLQNEGFDVMVCDNGEVALQKAQAFKPDLILLDLMMPRLSGFDAIELFRSTLETKAAKIIIFSALSQPEDIARTKQLGADDYLVKSAVTFINVISRIKALLNQPTTTDGLVSDSGELNNVS
jgi:DNA-binding response OmpR family regulator